MFAKFFRFVAALILTAFASQVSAQQCNQIRNGSGQIIAQECFGAPGSTNQWTPGSQLQISIGVPMAVPNGTNLNIPEGFALRQCTDEERIKAFGGNVVRNALLAGIDGWAQTNRTWGAEAGSRGGVRLAIAQTHTCYKLVKFDEVVVRPQQAPQDASTIKVVQVSGGAPLVNCDYDVVENGRSVKKRVNFYRPEGQTEWIPHTFKTCEATPYGKYEQAVAVRQ